MSDDALRELLKSPLDEPRPRRFPGWAGWLLAGLLVGSAAALIALPAVASDEEAADLPATSLVEPETTGGPVALTEGLTIEPLWASEHDGATWVSFATPVAKGTPTGDITPIPTMEWLLTTGSGRQVTGASEVADPWFPGVVTVEFPGDWTEDLDAATVAATPSRLAEEDDIEVALDANGLPWSGPVPPVAIGETAVVTESLDIGDDGGTLSWRLDGPRDQTVSVVAVFEYMVDGERRTLISESLLGQTPLQLRPPPPPPDRSGDITLFRTDDPDNPSFRSRWWGEDQPVAIDSLSVIWQLVRYEPTGDETIVPLDGILVVRDGN